MKRLWKMITCKHDYWWQGEATWSNSSRMLDHEVKEVICVCKKCGKEKSIKFKKTIDNTIQ